MSEALQAQFNRLLLAELRGSFAGGSVITVIDIPSIGISAEASQMGSSHLAVDTTGFSTEQKEYMAGFFAGVAQRTQLPFVGVTANGQLTINSNSASANLAVQEPAVHGTSLSDLNCEEKWKYEQNPLDIWDKLIGHAEENRAPSAEDNFRFKYHGLFYVAPAQDSFMLRLRIPGGILKAHQLRGLAELAEKWGAGRGDLTTRANMQIRGFQPKDIVRVLHAVQALGLTSRGSGADNIRNITITPTSGLDPVELYDVAPLAEALHHYILNSRDLYELPRKFNVAFDSGGTIGVLADTNDIGFQAVRIGAGKTEPSGIYFRVLLGGITGHRQFATDRDLLLRPEQTVAVAAAMIRVFIAHGDRTDRKKARLKYLIDRWGAEKFVAETQKHVAFPLLRLNAEQCEPRAPVDRTAHIGIHPQKQDNLHYLGVAIPVGSLPVEQMRAVAAIAEECGTGELRLTVWQNLLITNVPASRVKEALDRLRDAGLGCSAGAILRGTVACTGNRGCRYAATDTKTHAVELAQRLDSRLNIVQPVNLHVTGCPHSCAQHYLGDIGLLGTKVQGEEGYHVVIGGGAGKDQGLGRELIPSIRFSELPPLLERLFQTYAEQCRTGETFLDFSRRHNIDELRSMMVLKEAAAQ